MKQLETLVGEWLDDANSTVREWGSL